jgi:hypothetical protein
MRIKQYTKCMQLEDIGKKTYQVANLGISDMLCPSCIMIRGWDPAFNGRKDLGNLFSIFV